MKLKKQKRREFKFNRNPQIILTTHQIQFDEIFQKVTDEKLDEIYLEWVGKYPANLILLALACSSHPRTIIKYANLFQKTTRAGL